MKRILLCSLPALFLFVILNAASEERNTEVNLKSSEQTVQSEYEIIVGENSAVALQGYYPKTSYKKISILNPLNGSLFPRDIASPSFEWIDPSSEVDNWLVRVQFESGRNPLLIRCDSPEWLPGRKIWEDIKRNSLESHALITIIGCRHDATPAVVSEGSVRISTSQDPVGAPILFRRVPPSFSYADAHPESMEWCLADVSAYEAPRVIMSGQKYCASCHSFSRDGDTIGMDMDYMGDKGSYFLTTLQQDIILGSRDFISWNDFPRGDGLQGSGLFTRLSPDGNYAAGTVNDISFLAKIPDPYGSQLFFPIQGNLAFYAKKEKRFIRLYTGELDREIVETDPSWSADGQSIYFSRTVMMRDLYVELGGDTVFSAPDGDIKKLNAQYPVRFNVYRVPFNSGSGGRSVPLPGASNNGRSNYFARCSPDGRWIVFTQSDSGLVLQPDSRLCIVPAAGGNSRIMDCNRSRMNSWHSWSPNSRWLAFVSKENMPYTELYLTHIDKDGSDSVPVLVSRFNKPGFAVNVPEFANARARHLHSISLQYGGR